jgi:hypothetical protein
LIKLKNFSTHPIPFKLLDTAWTIFSNGLEEAPVVQQLEDPLRIGMRTIMISRIHKQAIIAIPNQFPDPALL